VSRRSLMAAGVRETVAREFLRLTAAGVSAEWAVVLARAPGRTRHRRRIPTRCGQTWG
jgi:hypothetical protein